MIPTGTRTAPRPLRIVTINLLHGGMTSELVGRDQHLEERLTMVVRELRTLDADVVGVQEASRGRRRGDVAARLASALGFHHVYAPAAPRWPLVSRVLGLEEGPAVLSRFPIVTSHVHPIDGCGGLYRRGLVCAVLATPRGALEACSTHLDGSDCDAERVASILGARPCTAPLLLMGDLNATEQSKGIRNLIAALGLVDTFREANPAAPGFTVWQPVWLERPFASRRVDFILLAPGANTRVRVVASRLVLNQPSRTQGRVLWPSDHYGVLSEVAILSARVMGRQGAVGRERRLVASPSRSRVPYTAGRPAGRGRRKPTVWRSSLRRASMALTPGTWCAGSAMSVRSRLSMMYRRRASRSVSDRAGPAQQLRNRLGDAPVTFRVGVNLVGLQPVVAQHLGHRLAFERNPEILRQRLVGGFRLQAQQPRLGYGKQNHLGAVIADVAYHRRQVLAHRGAVHPPQHVVAAEA